MRPNPETFTVARVYLGCQINISGKRFSNGCIGSVEVPQLGLRRYSLPEVFESVDELVVGAVEVAEGWISRSIDSNRRIGRDDGVS